MKARMTCSVCNKEFVVDFSIDAAETNWSVENTFIWCAKCNSKEEAIKIDTEPRVADRDKEE